MKTKTVRVHEVLADIEGSGPMGDGTKVFRFRDENEARKFAARNTCYGGSCSVTSDDVPRRLAQRWGLA